MGSWPTAFELAADLSTVAHIENLFDRHYQDAVGYPALGFNYRLGMRLCLGRGLKIESAPI